MIYRQNGRSAACPHDTAEHSKSSVWNFLEQSTVELQNPARAPGWDVVWIPATLWASEDGRGFSYMTVGVLRNETTALVATCWLEHEFGSLPHPRKHDKILFYLSETFEREVMVCSDLPAKLAARESFLSQPWLQPVQFARTSRSLTRSRTMTFRDSESQ